MNKNETEQRREWSNHNETIIEQATINEIVRSRILGLLMLQHIINKLKKEREIKIEEHAMADDRIIIIDYRVNPPPPNAIKEKVDSQNDDE